LKKVVAVILAAGRGTRMKSDMPKVLHEILGRPVIWYVIETLKDSGISDIVTVTGYGSRLTKKALKGTDTIVQKRLLGSGDAVKTAKKVLGNFRGDLLVICGDTPLIKPQTVKALVKRHRGSNASATVLTVRVPDPSGYGRIIRDSHGSFLKIAEENETLAYENEINEINAGTYCFKAGDIFRALSEIRPDNKKREYFLTDVIDILRNKGRTVGAFLTEDADETVGINTRIDLANARRIMNRRILEDLMRNGVTIEDPETTTVHPGAKVGKDTIIYSNTVIESDVEIGRHCHVGPFARLRPGVRMKNGSEVGNFVELVRTTIGEKTKVKHHTYLGDTIVGKNVNVGAGVITANYDGKRKNRTHIGDGVFIGIGARLIAPLKIGRGAVIGAGSVVLKNDNVPSGATVVGVPARVIKRRGPKQGRKNA
jgi:bifunctional UDP-N-acetylglucosamine pyrophosphorylase/glucosamine-1-phosphate N-acetyltransferase